MFVAGLASVVLATGAPVLANEVTNEVVTDEVVVDDGVDTIVEETPIVTPPSDTEEVQEETPVVTPPSDTGEVQEETPVVTPPLEAGEIQEDTSEVTPPSDTEEALDPSVPVASEEEIPFVPVKKEDGSTILGSSQGQVVLQTAEGTIQYVAPVAVGAEVKEDGSVVLKTSEGKLTRLPETGVDEVLSFGLSFSGLLMLVGTVFAKTKGLIGL